MRSFPSTVCWLALALVASANAPCRAQGFIEHVEPPVAERGRTTRVTFVGTRLTGATELWTSLPAGVVRAIPVPPARDGSVAFDLKVAADAPVGVCGVRVATTGSLSNVHLFLIDDLPVRPVPRPAAPPPKVAFPASLWGTFREAEVDRVAIDVQPGQRVSFEAVGNRFGKDADPLVTIRDGAGRWVAERDNDPGLYFDCRFEHVFTSGGTYTVEVRDSRFHGSPHATYVLRMGRFPAARVAVPAVVPPGGKTSVHLPELAGAAAVPSFPTGTRAGLALATVCRPGDEGSAWLPLEVSPLPVYTTSASNPVHERVALVLSAATAAGLPVAGVCDRSALAATAFLGVRAVGIESSLPAALCGVLDQPASHGRFWLRLRAGQIIWLHADARSFNSAADPEVVITDSLGRELKRAADPGQEEPVQFDFTAPTDGPYAVVVRDATRDGGAAFAYRVEVRPSGPRVQALAEVEGLTVPQGSWQPVPITLTRGNYNGPVRLSLHGAPPGITLTPTVVPGTDNSIVCKLAADCNVPTALYTFQIEAHTPSPWDGDSVRAVVAVPPTAFPLQPPNLTRTRPMIDRQRVNVDLIPFTLREDQRRLPPALTDRFALLVTPPSPFTVDLPEPTVTLARYLHADFPIRSTRIPGFDGPITFTARGGQLADKEEGRTRAYAEFPLATRERTAVSGSVHSRILANLGRTRIEVEASAIHSGRRISLTRTFDLDLRPAFEATAEPALTTLSPGSASRIVVRLRRVRPFEGPVRVQLSHPPGIVVAESVSLPTGQDAAEVEVRAATATPPGRYTIEMTAQGSVNSYEEDQRSRFEVEVRKPQPQPARR